MAYVVKLHRKDRTITVRHVTRKVTLRRVGQRGPEGPPGPPASNLVTSVNGRIGDVTGLAEVSDLLDIQSELDSKVPITRTINGHPLSSDVTINYSDIPNAPDGLVYSVKDFGAIGDGVTDDTAAIQAALGATPQRPVFIPAGRYNVSVSTGLNIPSGAILYGAGMNATVIAVADGDNGIGNIVKSEGTYSVTMYDFMVDGNKSGLSTDREVSTNYGVYLSNSDESHLERIRVINMNGVGVHVYNSTSVQVTNCVTSDNEYHGYEFEQTTSCILQGSDAHGNVRHGLFVSPGEVGGTGAFNNVFTGNVFTNNHQYGVAFGIDAAGLSIGLTRNNVVGNNTITGNLDYGVSIYRVDGVNVTGNVIANNGKIGIYIYRSHDNIVNANILRNNSQESDGAYDEILLEGYADGEGSFHNLISNNIINIDGDGTTIPRANFAIREATSGDGANVIKNNLIPTDGLSGSVQVLNDDTTYELVGDGTDNKMSIREFVEGVAIAPNATLPGSTMGLDAPFGTAALRFFNDNTGGNLQFVAPNGNADWYMGGNNTFSATSSGVSTHGYKLRDLADGSDPTDAVNKGQLDSAISGIEDSDVDSFNGRTGSVVPTSGDYTATLVTNTPAGGISSTNVQAAINELDSEKQTTDATLTSLAAFNTNGLITQTATDIFTGRTIAAGSASIVVLNGNGVSGNPSVDTAQNIQTSASPTFVGQTLTGNGTVAGYLRLGSNSAPLNTTAGDLTVGRLLVGSNIALDASNGRVARIIGTITDTTGLSSGAVIQMTAAPSSVSTAEVRSLNMSVITSGTNSHGTLSGGYFETRVSSNASISSARGIQGYGAVVVDATYSTTISNSIGIFAQSYNVANNPGGTISAATGILVANPPAVGSGGMVVTNSYGIDVNSQTRGATTNVGIRVAAPSGATSNYAFQLSDSGGTSAGGITFGTDTNLYRSASSTLKTDSALQTAGKLSVLNPSDTGALEVDWSTNVVRVFSTSSRNLNVGDSGGYLDFAPAASSGSPKFTYNRVTGTSGSLFRVTASSMTAGAATTQYGIKIDPTYNQTSTAAANDIWVNRTETAVGTGAQNLIIAQVGGSTMFSVNNKGKLFIASSTAPASPVNGDIWFDGTDVKIRVGGVTKTFTLV